MEGAASTTMTSLLATLGEVVKTLIDNVGTVFEVIASHPIALIWVGVSIAFVIVKFAKYILGM